VHFEFSEEQLMFRDQLRIFLEKECTPASVRARWETETGRSPELWGKLAEMGLLGLRAEERFGGLGMDEVDFVLLFEEAGRVALPEPLLETAAVGVPLLAAIGGDLAGTWLPRVTAGEAILTIGHGLSPVVADAHVADLLLLEREGALWAAPREAVTMVAQPCSDASRRLFVVEMDPGSLEPVARGGACAELMAAATDRGALATAGLQIGLAERMVELAVEYAGQREQFGKPIGSFQAIKHMLASVAVAIEFARPLAYRAAHAVARGEVSRPVDVSQANAAASDAALLAARTALQVHGAIGYTWEVDLHLWMKRAWALESAWGSRRWHRRRIAAALLDSDVAPTFGFGAAL
jgi:alkylation response protein AidB-like acyl-CoA dehydrogenase